MIINEMHKNINWNICKSLCFHFVNSGVYIYLKIIKFSLHIQLKLLYLVYIFISKLSNIEIIQSNVCGILI